MIKRINIKKVEKMPTKQDKTVLWKVTIQGKNKEFEAFCTDSKISCLDFPTEAEFNVIEENNKIFLRYPPQEIMGIQPRVQIASMSLRIATDVVLAYKDDKQKPITQDGAVEIIKMIQENLFTHFLNLINNNTSTDKEL